MRIFITGGTGFIGKPLCHALQGHELLVLSRHPAKLTLPFPWQPLNGDYTGPADWKIKLTSFQPDVCLHLAWSNLPDYTMPNNIVNFHAGLELFRLLADISCKRVVVTGTCFEYGSLMGCVREDQALGVQGLFAAFKTAQRVIGQSLFAKSSTTFLWARPFFVYGPRQRATSLIPSTIAALRSGATPDIRTPDAVQDFIYVDDVARGLAALATSNAPAGVYNLGSGRPAVVREIVNLIARQMGKSEVYEESNENGGGFWADMKQTTRHTGWFPSVSIEEGVALTLSSQPN